MQPTSRSGYELCYLEGRQSVSVSDATSDNDFDFGAPIAVPAEGLLTWGRTAFAVVIVAVLVTLGIANVAMYSRWHEVEDGVLWGSRAEGVTALDVATGSAAAVAGIQRGDVLVAVNGAAVESPADVIEFQHRGKTGTRLSYTLLRLGTRQALEVSLAPSPH